MEVGIREGRENTLFIYDHWGEYTLSKKPRGWYTAYTPQYTTGYRHQYTKKVLNEFWN